MDINFNKIVQTADLFFRYSKGPSIEKGKEFHIFHEILYMKRIDGTLITEKENIDINSGAVIIIPKETFHKFIMRNHGEYTRCCFQFDNIAAIEELINICTEQIVIIKSPTKETIELFEKLINMFERGYSIEEQRLLTSSVFTQMLLSIKQDLKNCDELNSRDKNSIIYKALEYINKLYCQPISIKDVSYALSVSESTLAHLFKKELNISVYKYISDKRMILAKKLLLSGESALETGLKCGYKDYTAFYRSYKKYYGESPSESKK